jgi:hypothetical protein
MDLAFSSPEDCSPVLAAAFDELTTPYRVDGMNWKSLRHEGLRQHIARFGVRIQVHSVSKWGLPRTADWSFSKSPPPCWATSASNCVIRNW